ncbi:hypothetical protein K466DRAFT_662196 [Polyporus arcularius HHB13444]|uniref:Zn(2)-C6 fungal-type domain-containing protein n=1 Tax=Polyporus arcularius HHB13444 TaxID=1314778 RepID=A0A5C3PH42_9APHY|nr:hypothetical protein K466DRAFT_662196 [Polyporus arcularius HHB13444]
MSGDGDSFPPRRRNHHRACDLCRRRKVCCDASEVAGNQCSRCTAAGIDCQYSPGKKASARLTMKYVEALEDRLKRMEGLIEKLHPNAQTIEHLGSDSSEGDPKPASGSVSVGAMTLFDSPSPSVPTATPLHPPPLYKLTQYDSDQLESSDDDAEVAVGSAVGFLGKSSNKDLVLNLMHLKKGEITDKRFLPQLAQKRLNWKPRPYEIPVILDDPHTVPYSDFPEPDLMIRLVDAYFEHFNVYLPLLHRPTLEHDIQRGLHIRDRSFGSVVLLVCAMGAIWTQDHRLPPPPPGVGPGWEWFDQVGHEQWSLLTRPKLHDIQACALMAAYMCSSHVHQSNWMILTLGIRMAIDVGAHRNKTYDTFPTAEQEQWKRAFWVLVAMDRLASFALGRPCAIHEEDFDVDPMTECDDEYWTSPDPALSFKQPAGKPSKITFANCFIRLLMILAFASRTIYTINKSKLLLGFVGTEWKQNIVAEIDSALNKWRDSVPEHRKLRWDPRVADPIFFKQSAFLYTNFYQIQIFIHRQFIPSPRHPRPSHQLPSLMICVSAARACMEVVKVQWKRTGVSDYALTPLHMVLFNTCLVVLVNLWGGKPSEREAEALVADVRKCMDIMKALEGSNPAATRIRTMLTALMTFTPSKPSSSSPGQRAQPSDFGDLIIAAMETLRLSLTGDPRLEDKQFEDLLYTIKMRNSKSGKVPSDPKSSSHSFATTSSSTASPEIGEMSAFYDSSSPQDAPLLPTGTISEGPATDSSPATQQRSSVFLPSSYRGSATPPASGLAPTSTSTAPHEGLNVSGPDGMMDLAMCGDSLLETLAEYMQQTDGASAGTYPPPDPLYSYHPQAPVEAEDPPMNPEADFSTWLAGEVGGDAPWAMPPVQVSPSGDVDWNTYLQMMGPLPYGEAARPGY